MISVERSGNVALLRLSRGAANPINLDLIQRFRDVLRELEQDPSAGALVLTGNEKFLSIGFDLPELMHFPRAEFADFFQDFNELCLELYAFSKPTVAAVTGHAVAGGFILAICCDTRFVAEGHKLMGMNEVKLGVPVPFATGCILRDLIGTRAAREIMDGGEFYEPPDALRLGVADRILPLESVLPEAIAHAGRLASEPAEAFAATKRILTEPVEQRIRPRLADTHQSFLDRWFSNEAQARLREAAGRFRS